MKPAEYYVMVAALRYQRVFADVVDEVKLNRWEQRDDIQVLSVVRVAEVEVSCENS